VADERDPRLPDVLRDFLDDGGDPAGPASEVTIGGFAFSSSEKTSAVCRARTSGLVTI
jgi:hypothetical protein